MANQPTLDVQYAIKSYRYLRLAIVVMVALVMVSVLAEEDVAVGRRSFLENAHDKTAIAMFAAIGLAVWTRARRSAQGVFRRGYWIAAGVMIAGVVVPFAAKIFIDGFEHEVIWIEAVELVGFGIFWIVQSVEHWNLEIICGHPESDASSGSEPVAHST